MPGPVLTATDLQLRYGTQVLFNGATMTIAEGEKVGLIGRNGTGKSSLFRVLSGDDQPDAGTLARSNGITAGILPQDFRLEEDQTVMENIRSGAHATLALIARYEGGDFGPAEEADLLHEIDLRDAWNLDTLVSTLMNELSTPPGDRIVRDLSGGEKRRVALARALIAKPDLLMLDEPTNHLDAESIAWLEGYLKSFQGAVLFVTHDRYFLDRIATRILELDGGKLYSHPGNYSAFVESKALRQSVEADTERRRQAFLKHELEFVRAGVKAQRSKSRNRLEQYDIIASKEGPAQELSMELIIPDAPEMGNVVLDATEVGAQIDGRWLFTHLNLTFEPGTCTGIVGRNGLGKTTLLRMLMGQRDPDQGTVNIGKRTVFNYVDQQRLLLDPEMTVAEAVAGKADFVTFGSQRLHVRSYLKRFLFTDDRVTMRVKELSGGEKSRVLLARILQRGGNFIILDEPTNDLDLDTMRVLEEAILAFDGVALIVSHDRYFLDRICDRVIAFEGNGQVHECAGNYSYYTEKRAAIVTAEQALVRAKVDKPKPTPSAPAVKARKFSAKEQRELATTEQRIAELEQAIATDEASLSDPAFFAKGQETTAFIAALDKKRSQLETVFARWTELEEIRVVCEA